MSKKGSKKSRSRAKGKSRRQTKSKRRSPAKSKRKSPAKSKGKSPAKSKRRSPAKSKRRSPAKSKGKKNQLTPLISLDLDTQLDIIGYVLLASALLTLLAILSGQQGAILGTWVNFLTLTFGWGVYIVPFFVGAVGLYLVLRRFGDRFPRPQSEQVAGILILYLAALTTIHFVAIWITKRSAQEIADAGQGGGYLGGGAGALLIQGLGNIGAALVLVTVWILGIFFTFGISPAEMVRGLLSLIQRLRQTRIPIQLSLPSLIKAKTAPKSSLATKEQPAQITMTAQQLGASSTSVGDPLFPHLIGQIPRETPVLDTILEPGSEQNLDQEILRQQTRVIEETLLSLGAPAKVVEINQGPVVTQFGVQPLFVTSSRGKQTKVKVSKIASLADDLALALSAKTLRVQAPVPRKGLVGIEVPNQQISLVALRDIIESKAWEQTAPPLRLGLGQDVSGMPYVADLRSMPHLLIAGTTGSGKSVCINSILAALLLQNTPENLKLLMVDPKRVELTLYNGIPHLLSPVVVEMERVLGALHWVLREMDGRYRKFSQAGARDIVDYNTRLAQEDETSKILPYIVVIVDELADLMMLAPQETERAISRLAQMARATGIHLILATQRPSVDVVTGLIKANFPTRIAFAVASSVDSRVILDMPGAERLLGRGDMLFVAADVSQPVRLQGAFVSDTELGRLVRYWKGGQELELPQPVKSAVPSPPSPPVQLPLQEALVVSPSVQFEDDLIPDVLMILLAENRASISLLQRRLRIGYTRSARIIDLLEEKEIIGPPQPGGKAREVNRVAAEALLHQAGGG